MGFLRTGASVVLSACACATGPASAAESLQDTIIRDVPGAPGTVVLVHGGGWTGPDRQRQWDIDFWPGTVFRDAGWNTATIDYAAGKEGLASVTAEIGAAMARAPFGRVCVYAESAGGHLALLAAAALPRLRCVMGLGVPTDLERWRDDATRQGRVFSLTTYSQTAGPTFGYGDIEDRWQPVAVADHIRGRVLLVGQADDHVLPIRGQLEGFDAVRPATELLITEAGDYGDETQRYLHGSFSPEARSAFQERLRSFLSPPRRSRQSRRRGAGRRRPARQRDRAAARRATPPWVTCPVGRLGW